MDIGKINQAIENYNKSANVKVSISVLTKAEADNYRYLLTDTDEQVIRGLYQILKGRIYEQSVYLDFSLYAKDVFNIELELIPESHTRKKNFFTVATAEG